MLDKEDKKQQLNHTKKLGNLSYINYLKSQQDTLNLIFSIQKYLETYPPFYLNSIVINLKGRPLDFVKNQLQKQYDKLLNRTSFYHSMNASIQARNNCINKIKRDLTRSMKFLNLFHRQYSGASIQNQNYTDWVQIQGYSTIQVDETIQNSIKMLSNIFVDMYRLRDITIYIVQTIYAWKINLEEHSDRCHQFMPVHYYYQGNNVYEMILSDTDFLWKSKLSEYIYMQAKQDPFLIRNVIQVEQRQIKTVLQKYFLQILYPKEEITVDKSIKCFQMLLFKYKPKISSLFQEQELLIQNYLKMEMKNNEFDQQKLGQKRYIQEPNNNKIDEVQQAQAQTKKKKKNLLNVRGWVFDQNLKGKAKERINKIVQKHQDTIKYIAPFNIVNYNEKTSIALAYLSEAKKNQNMFRARVQTRTSSNIHSPKLKQQPQFMSEGEGYRSENYKNNYKRNAQSQPEPQYGKESRMFKSLTKLHPIILEDPKQQIPDTPKNKSKPQQSIQFNNRQHSLNHIKLNSFMVDQNDTFQQKIKIQQQQTPLNIKQFYQIFRADTKAKPKFIKESQNNAKSQKETQKIIKFKQFLQNSRLQRAKSLHTFRKPKITFPSKKKVQQKKLDKSRSKDKSGDSYPQFEKIKHEEISNSTLKEYVNKSNSNQFINIKAKSIPYDLILSYVKHIYSQIHQTSKKFMNFSINQIIKKMADPYIHCIMLQLSTENHKNIGQVILSQSIGGRAGRLKYTIEFFNVHSFQYIIASILRISEELLSTTPCQEVICPLYIDKLDIVSTHFIELIGAGLAQKVGKFGRLAILQKLVATSYKEDIRERLYIITSETCFKKQYELGLKMMGNYRSLKFQTKCLVLTSNFRLRSKNLMKNALNKYKKVALGELFVKLFRKVMTKYHIKHFKGASYSSNDGDEFANVIKNDLFLRNIMNSFTISLKNENEESGSQLIYLTPFTTMGDFLNYIHYKKHDLYFQFQFLQDSKFILNHELYLAELDQEVSLQFTMTSNQQIYILYNHKHVQLTMLRSTKMNTEAYLIPTNNDKIHLFIMNSRQYLQTATDQLDMYSYLSYYFKNLHSQIYLNQVPSIIFPSLKQNNIRINKVRMYDGFFKIFPERQFYSAAMIRCLNYWERYYPNAVAHNAPQNSIIFEFPFLLGFYDVKSKTLLHAFIYSDVNQNSP